MAKKKVVKKKVPAKKKAAVKKAAAKKVTGLTKKGKPRKRAARKNPPPTAKEMSQHLPKLDMQKLKEKEEERKRNAELAEKRNKKSSGHLYKKGNTIWTRRSKHGRNALFESAELLLAAFQEYIQLCHDNPWYKKEVIKSGDAAGLILDVPCTIPYSIGGFCLYCDTYEGWWNQFKTSKTGQREDFTTVIRVIETTIKTQKFNGVTVGAFNATVMVRELGLVDRQATVTTDRKDVANLFPTEEEFEELLKEEEESKKKT